MFRWLKDRSKKSRKSTSSPSGSVRSKDDDYGFKRKLQQQQQLQQQQHQQHQQTNEYKRDLPPTPADVTSSCCNNVTDDDKSLHIYEEIPDLPFRCTPEGELRIHLAREEAWRKKGLVQTAQGRPGGGLGDSSWGAGASSPRNISPYMVVPLERLRETPSEFRATPHHNHTQHQHQNNNQHHHTHRHLKSNDASFSSASDQTFACALVGRKRGGGGCAGGGGGGSGGCGTAMTMKSSSSCCGSPGCDTLGGVGGGGCGGGGGGGGGSSPSCCGSSVFGSPLTCVEGGGGGGGGGEVVMDMSDRLLSAINLTRLLAAVRLSSSSAETCTTSPICIGVDRDGSNISVSVTPTTSLQPHHHHHHHQHHHGNNTTTTTNNNNKETAEETNTNHPDSSSQSTNHHHHHRTSTFPEHKTGSESRSGLEEHPRLLGPDTEGVEASNSRPSNLHPQQQQRNGAAAVVVDSSSGEGERVKANLKPVKQQSSKTGLFVASNSNCDFALTEEKRGESGRGGKGKADSVTPARATGEAGGGEGVVGEGEDPSPQASLRYLPSPTEQTALTEILQLRPGERAELDPATIDALLLKLCSHMLQAGGGGGGGGLAVIGGDESSRGGKDAARDTGPQGGGGGGAGGGAGGGGGGLLHPQELEAVENMLKEMLKNDRRHHHHNHNHSSHPGEEAEADEAEEAAAVARQVADNSDTGFEYDVSTSSGESDQQANSNYDYFLSKVARTRSLECEVKKLIRRDTEEEDDDDDIDDDDDDKDEEEEGEDDGGEDNDDYEEEEEEGGEESLTTLSLTSLSPSLTAKVDRRQAGDDSDDAGTMADLSESENSSGYYESGQQQQHQQLHHQQQQQLTSSSVTSSAAVMSSGGGEGRTAGRRKGGGGGAGGDGRRRRQIHDKKRNAVTSDVVDLPCYEIREVVAPSFADHNGDDDVLEGGCCDGGSPKSNLYGSSASSSSLSFRVMTSVADPAKGALSSRPNSAPSSSCRRHHHHHHPHSHPQQQQQQHQHSKSKTSGKKSRRHNHHTNSHNSQHHHHREGRERKSEKTNRKYETVKVCDGVLGFPAKDMAGVTVKKDCAASADPSYSSVEVSRGELGEKVLGIGSADLALLSKSPYSSSPYSPYSRGVSKTSKSHHRRKSSQERGGGGGGRRGGGGSGGVVGGAKSTNSTTTTTTSTSPYQADYPYSLLYAQHSSPTRTHQPQRRRFKPTTTTTNNNNNTTKSRGSQDVARSASFQTSQKTPRTMVPESGVYSETSRQASEVYSLPAALPPDPQGESGVCVSGGGGGGCGGRGGVGAGVGRQDSSEVYGTRAGLMSCHNRLLSDIIMLNYNRQVLNM